MWLQAAYLEGATLARRSSAAALLDLVKAFNRVSHAALLVAAERWSFPLWILRLSVAAYRMGRRIAINGLLSNVIYACRSITAGSTFATTELRLLLLSALESVAAAFPALPLMVYVDDMFLAAIGTENYVCRMLPAAVRLLARKHKLWSSRCP